MRVLTELFESRQTRRARRAMDVRLARKKVDKYIGDCHGMSNRYLDLARKALALGRQDQCDQYLYRRIQYEQQAEKWSSFQLCMEDLSLRGKMSTTIGDLLNGMHSLTREIRDSMAAKDINKVVAELNLSMGRLDQWEEQVSVAMDTMDYEIGTPQEERENDRIPEEQRQALEQMRAELLDEVVVQEGVGNSPGLEPLERTTKTDDSRIKAGLDRVRKLKKFGDNSA